MTDDVTRARNDGAADGSVGARWNADRWRGTDLWATYLVAWGTARGLMRPES